MLTFDPPELEARLRSAVSKLADFASLTLENVDLVKGFELDDFPDMEVSPETVLGLDLPRCERESLTVTNAIDLVDEASDKRTIFDGLRRRLLTPDALNPTAAFMDGLLALFEENRQFTKDFEALRLTVERCCDPLILAKHAPAFLTTLCVVSATSKPSERRQALAELSACLSATRNQLAHAKANYELTGRECPDAQLWSLVACAKLAAEQCIRWYASQNPGLRRA